MSIHSSFAECFNDELMMVLNFIQLSKIARLKSFNRIVTETRKRVEFASDETP